MLATVSAIQALDFRPASCGGVLKTPRYRKAGELSLIKANTHVKNINVNVRLYCRSNSFRLLSRFAWSILLLPTSSLESGTLSWNGASSQTPGTALRREQP